MSVLYILFFVFSGLFTASTILNIIACGKKIRVMEYICRPAQYVFMLAAELMVLIPRIPDSIHIIAALSFSVASTMASSCILLFPKKRKLLVTSISLLILSYLSFIHIIGPSFILFSLPGAATACTITVYVLILTLYYFFVTDTRNIIKSIAVILLMVPIIIMHYGSLLTLFGQPRLYSILLTAGSTVLIISQVMTSRGFFKRTSDNERLIKRIIQMVGLLFVTAGFTVMVCV
ncbi:MAG: hypothetical protein II098_01970 [Treponema sp.]|nr:hypothetical protein [Treponema sp.]